MNQELHKRAQDSNQRISAGFVQLAGVQKSKQKNRTKYDGARLSSQILSVRLNRQRFLTRTIVLFVVLLAIAFAMTIITVAI